MIRMPKYNVKQGRPERRFAGIAQAAVKWRSSLEQAQSHRLEVFGIKTINEVKGQELFTEE